jgi:glycosyltransferase involved in cell wall biosynthesis
MNLPSISIVTPSLNQGQFLERTVQSVSSQEYPNLEYLVMDGGSTDTSISIIQKYSARITLWRSHRDNGQSDAVCEGWQKSKGEILGWLNSDDYYYPNALATVGEFFAQNPDVLVVWGSIAIVDGNGQVLRVKQPRSLSAIDLLLFKDVPGQAGAFVRRSVFEEVGGPRLDLHYVLDWELWLRIALRYPAAAIGLLPQTLAAATEWHGAKTVTAATKDIEEVRRVLEELFAQSELPPPVRAVEKAAYARCWWRQSKAELALGQRGPALRSLFKSVQTSPATVGLWKAARQTRRIVLGSRSEETRCIKSPLGLASATVTGGAGTSKTASN